MCQSCLAIPKLSRRRLLTGSLAMAASASLLPALPAAALESHGAPVATVAPNEAWERLRLGNQRFLDNVRRNVDYAADRPALALSQNPFAAILSCADSRVVPELAFDAKLGELFTARVAGNVVDTDVLGSFEHAVAALHTRLIVVLGHSRCGAVEGAVQVVRDKAVLPGHRQQLIQPILPAAEAAIATGGEDVLAAAVRENIRFNVEALKKAGPIIGPAFAKGDLAIIGAHYDLATGTVTAVDPA